MTGEGGLLVSGIGNSLVSDESDDDDDLADPGREMERLRRLSALCCFFSARFKDLRIKL